MSLKLKLHIFQNPPYLFANEDPSLRGNARYSGFVPDLVEMIADATGHNMEIVLPSDGRSGKCYSKYESRHNGWQ